VHHKIEKENNAAFKAATMGLTISFQRAGRSGLQPREELRGYKDETLFRDKKNQAAPESAA
jgi:hypothetical protein